MENASLVIEFAPGSRVQPTTEPLHVCMSMEIVLSDGQQVLLPADQVVFFEDSNGSARVGLGGMSFEGVQEEQLVFWRVRDLLPDEHLSPQRELRVTLVPETVKSIHVRGNRVWPSRQPANPLH